MRAICGKASLAACCLALLTAASEDDGPVVEMSNAVIASRDEERLRVVFAAEGQPTRGGAWDWRDTSKIVISVASDPRLCTTPSWPRAAAELAVV